MRLKFLLFIMMFLTASLINAEVTVLSSDSKSLKLHISIDPFSSNDLKPFHIAIGLPSDQYPEMQVHMLNKQYLNGIAERTEPASVEWLQKQKLRRHFVGTLIISPGSDGIDNTQYYNEMIINISFPKSARKTQTVADDKILSNKLINWSVAKNWQQPRVLEKSKISSLPDGQWIKFNISEDGIYSISGSILSNIMSEIEQTDTRSLMLFTGSTFGRAIPQYPGAPLPEENLIEVGLKYSGNENGAFSNNDKVIFYGRGASGFDLNSTSIFYNHNLYFTENTYWLLIPDDVNMRGKRIQTDQTSITPSVTFDYGIQYLHIETDLVNPFESGLGWAELTIPRNSSIERTVTVHNPINNVPAKLSYGLQGGTTDLKVRPAPFNKVAISYGSSQNAELSYISWSGLGKRNTTITLANGTLTNGSNSFFFNYLSTDNYSNPYFDYLTLSYGRLLQFTTDPIEFYTPIYGNPMRFTITSTNVPTIWNISDASSPFTLLTEQSGNDHNFDIQPPANSYDRIIAFTPEMATPITTVKFVGRKRLNTLRNSTNQAEHLILAPAEFADVCQKLVAHRGNSRFIALEDVYDEFSGGNADPMAIRSFLKWTQDNWQAPKPMYLFIFGDADYDYRNITGNSKIIVPTIEIGVVGSWASDDRLAAFNGAIPEIAIGRFPARTIAESENFIAKLVEFETNPEYGLWRQRITLVADDGARPEDETWEINVGKSHTINSEILAEIIPPTFEIYKLYMLEFPEESDASSFGVSKPAATTALFEILEKGSAIVNFIGHGSEHQWTQERLLYQDRGDLNVINTGMKLPLWIAGTCEWGHFDAINAESFSEEIIRQPMNGASAIITTTRSITVSNNQKYEELIFNNIFPNGAVTNASVGVILQTVKLGDREGEFFQLFGDPAMKLVLPKSTVAISNVTPDTLKTLGEATFTAEHNISQNGGEGFVILKDAQRDVNREYNFKSTVQELSYKLPGATLFRGKFDFNDNQFSSKLRVPKDISFSDKPASLKLYLKSNDSQPIEALGWQDSLFIISGGNTTDSFGPMIGIETTDQRKLKTGDHIKTDDKLLIRLTDPLGINVTGEPGHDIVLNNLTDDNTNVVTNEFVYDNNSITTGTIPLDIDDTSEIHLSLKAWDSANNPTEVEIKLHRISKANLKLFNVTNFPNPFAGATQFIFELSQPAEISIMIYTLGGRRIMEIEPELYATGFHTIDWDGKDAFSGELANGVYLYRLKAISDEETASFIGRLAKYK